MNAPQRWATLIFYAAGAIGAALITWGITSAHYQAQIADLKRGQAEAVATARAADIKSLQQAVSHGNALTLQLQATESTLSKKEKELSDAIRSKTTGRACLSGSVVRLLNNATTDSAVSVPATAAGVAAADGAAATDTDVAQWANLARTQYDICRARLDALIDW